jgi:parvulin-like peptidyl-prolyl isomerase
VTDAVFAHFFRNIGKSTMHWFKFLSITTLMMLAHNLHAADDQDLTEGVLAVRGQGTVTPQEFDARVSKIPEEDRTTVLRDASKVRTMIGNLLLTSQLVSDARGNSFGEGDELLQLRLKMAAETELANAWLDHKTNIAPDADYTSLAQEYFLLNEKNFVSEDMVDVTHLLISIKERPLDEAESLAQSYLEQALSNPDSFDEMVTSYSEDPAAMSNKGRYIDVKRGMMVKPFEDAAFGLKNVGEFSGLVPTQYGIHIIRLDRINPSHLMSFEEIQPQLEARLEKEHRERVRVDYLRSLTVNPTSISDEEIKAMLLRYFDEEDLKLQSDSSDNE